MLPEFRKAALVAAAALLAAACGDESNPVEPPTTGSVTINVVTTGGLLDPNGYQVTRTGAATLDVPVNGSVTVDSLAPGAYTFALGKASLYCAVENGTTREATVVVGGNAQVTFTVRCEPNGVAYSTFNNGVASLFIAFPGRDPITLATGVSAARFRFSPDRRRLAYAASPAGGGPATIHVIDLDSLGITMVTPAGSPNRLHPAWSPDGTHIAYATTSSLRIIRLGETTETTIWTAPAGFFVIMPTWSPDGSKIAFLKASTSFAPPKIVVMNADGTQERELITLRALPYLQLDWSADGSSILYNDVPEGLPLAIYTVNVATGAEKLVASNTNLRYLHPTYLRDGRIGFYAENPAGGIASGNWIVSADGTGLTQVFLPGTAGAPVTAWQ